MTHFVILGACCRELLLLVAILHICGCGNECLMSPSPPRTPRACYRLFRTPLVHKLSNKKLETQESPWVQMDKHVAAGVAWLLNRLEQMSPVCRDFILGANAPTTTPFSGARSGDTSSGGEGVGGGNGTAGAGRVNMEERSKAARKRAMDMMKQKATEFALTMDIMVDSSSDGSEDDLCGDSGRDGGGHAGSSGRVASVGDHDATLALASSQSHEDDGNNGGAATTAGGNGGDVIDNVNSSTSGGGGGGGGGRGAGEEEENAGVVNRGQNSQQTTSDRGGRLARAARLKPTDKKGSPLSPSVSGEGMEGGGRGRRRTRVPPPPECIVCREVTDGALGYIGFGQRSFVLDLRKVEDRDKPSVHLQVCVSCFSCVISLPYFKVS